MKNRQKNDFARGLALISQSLGKERVRMDESLKEYTFSKVESKAQALYVATNEAELIKVLDISFQLKVPLFLLGSGTKSVFADQVSGLVVKNRTGVLKVVAFKGKVAKTGLGVEEAMIEVSSGVSLSRLNEFLASQNLELIAGISSLLSSIGGSIFWDPAISERAEKIKVWEEGNILEIDSFQLRRAKQVILSIVIKAKARS